MPSGSIHSMPSFVSVSLPRSGGNAVSSLINIKVISMLRVWFCIVAGNSPITLKSWVSVFNLILLLIRSKLLAVFLLKSLYCFKLMTLTSAPLSASVLNITPSTWTSMYLGFSSSWFTLWICKCLTILSNSSSLVLQSLISRVTLTCRLCQLGWLVCRSGFLVFFPLRHILAKWFFFLQVLHSLPYAGQSFPGGCVLKPQ